MTTVTTALHRTHPMMVTVLAALLATACACGPDESRARQGAKSGAAIGAGIGLLLGVLSGDSEVAARAVAVGAASGAVHGGYEGWRQDQDDERTRQITQAIKDTQRSNLDDDARQREELTRFLGVWQMTGWLQEPGQNRIGVSAQVNGNVHMSYFVELAWIDLQAEGFDGTVWGTTTLGYDADSGYEMNTRFNTVPDSLEVSGGSFSSGNRTFTFADAEAVTTIRFETPDRFHVRTEASGTTVESYTFTRS